jgi:hypothetical protein
VRSKALQAWAQAPKAWAKSFPETAGSGWLHRKDLYKDNRYDKSFSVHRGVLHSWKNHEGDIVTCQHLFN